MDSNRIKQLTQILITLIPLPGQPRISEYDLICELRRREVDEFLQFDLSNSLDLFRCHFLLYHLLYTIQKQWLQEEVYHLEISALQIAKRPFSNKDSRKLSHHDPLQEYYLDFTEYHAMQHADVELLIRGFWSKMIEPESREKALAALELKDPVTDRQIKQQYRRLAMKHHPDRGGAAELLQQINQAMKILSN